MTPSRADLAARLAKARAAKAQKRQARIAEAKAAAPPEPEAVPAKGAKFDIVEMLTSPRYLGDEQVSPAQVSVLKAVYGLPMTGEEREEFLRMSEGREPRAGGYGEATIIAGTGAGKDAKIACPIAVYEAITFDTSVLSPGEKAIVALVAQDVDGANIAFGYCEGYLRLLEERGWNVLYRGRVSTGGPREKEVVGREIRVRENLAIRIFPCKKGSVRGASVIAAVLDEIAWWRTEEGAYNSDVEIQRAIRGRRRAHTKVLRVVKITSPYLEEGVAFQDFEQRANGRRLVLQAPTWILNPALSRESMLEEELDDPEAFLRERGAQFGKGGGNFISGKLVDLCTDAERTGILPKQPGKDYHGALDVAFKRDMYAAGVAHREGDDVVIDGIFWRQGSKRKPLDDREVNREAAEFYLSFGVDTIVGDQFADVPTQSEFRDNGIEFKSEAQSAPSNHLMFKNLKAAMKRGRVRLPNDPTVRKDLTGLIAKNMPGGLTRVAAPERVGCHDDISKVIAILVLKLLPMTERVDLADLNKGAVVERSHSVPTLDDWSSDIMGAVL